MKKKEAMNAFTEIMRNVIEKYLKIQEAKNTYKELGASGHLKLSRK